MCPIVQHVAAQSCVECVLMLLVRFCCRTIISTITRGLPHSMFASSRGDRNKVVFSVDGRLRLRCATQRPRQTETDRPRQTETNRPRDRARQTAAAAADGLCFYYVRSVNPDREYHHISKQRARAMPQNNKVSVGRSNFSQKRERPFVCILLCVCYRKRFVYGGGGSRMLALRSAQCVVCMNGMNVLCETCTVNRGTDACASRRVCAMYVM